MPTVNEVVVFSGARAAKSAPKKSTKPAEKPAKPSKPSAPKPTTPKAPSKAQKGVQRPKKVVKEATPKKAAAPKVVKKTTKAPKPPRTDVTFKEGSDAAYIWTEICQGGESRAAVQERIKAHFANVTTRGGKPKAVSTVMNYIIRQALATGKYTIAQSWSVVPVPGAAEETPTGESTPTAPVSKVKVPKPSSGALASAAVALGKAKGPRLPKKATKPTAATTRKKAPAKA